MDNGEVPVELSADESGLAFASDAVAATSLAGKTELQRS